MTSADPVAAVIGTQVRLYGPADEKTNVRPLREVIDFTHRGAALDFATTYDERHKPVAPQGRPS